MFQRNRGNADCINFCCKRLLNFAFLSQIVKLFFDIPAMIPGNLCLVEGLGTDVWQNAMPCLLKLVARGMRDPLGGNAGGQLSAGTRRIKMNTSACKYGRNSIIVNHPHPVPYNQVLDGRRL